MKRRISIWEAITGVLCILLLFSFLPSYLQRQREAARQKTCENNLREFGIQMRVFGERDAAKRICSGAFSLRSDGCPDVRGWVGDIAAISPVFAGQKLCPANTLTGNEHLNELVGYVDFQRTPVETLLPGVKLATITSGFCKPFVIKDSLGTPNADGILPPGDAERITLIKKQLEKGYNTNYSQSWFAARENLRITNTGMNSATIVAKGEQTDLSGGASGLQVRVMEKSHVATSNIPLLGDAAPGINPQAKSAVALNNSIAVGTRLTQSFGRGPVAYNPQKQAFDKMSDLTNTTTNVSIAELLKNDVLPLPDAEGFGGVDIDQDGETDKLSNANAYGGNDNLLMLQDTRNFAALHRSGNKLICNMLMGDGSIKQLEDKNGDGYLNPGFNIQKPKEGEQASTESVCYTNAQAEIGPADLYSGPVIELSFIKKVKFEAIGGSHDYAGPSSTPSYGSYAPSPAATPTPYPTTPPTYGSGDAYKAIAENGFKQVTKEPLSTFSIDVDTASYSKTRQYIMQYNRLPPADAVRVEEFINYFDYDYASPEGKHPLATYTVCSDCPWNPQHKLVRIGVKGRELLKQDMPRQNLVFLVDVSGSMQSENRLPLVKQGLHMLTNQLTAEDKVTLVVYAGATGCVLPPTSGLQKDMIHAAIDRLESGGSTNGGAGIQLAYAKAKENFMKEGNNRVLLCTDGDFNVGITNTTSLTELAKQESKSGVYLTLLGFGMGNLNDTLLKELSKNANGNYFFVDSEKECRKVLVDEITGTLTAIAKDVKIQVEFNPARVQEYRLVGYENRILAAEDFKNDKKDAGEIGAGHRVTVFYELVPTGVQSEPEVDALRYQKNKTVVAVTKPEPIANVGNSEYEKEWLNVKIRYKPIDSETSIPLEYPLAKEPLKFSETPEDYQFATSVAMFGMLLHKSKHATKIHYDTILELANALPEEKRTEARKEFIDMVKRAKQLDHSSQ